MTNIRILTCNTRGLNDSTKRRELFYYLHKKEFDIMLLQECHSTVDCEKIWSSEWGNTIWFSHGASNARGVALVIRKALKIEVHNILKDDEGRYLILYVTIEGHKWLLGNVYAPNEDSPQFFTNFFADVERFNPEFMIIGGDLNLGLDTKVDRSGLSRNNDKAAKIINETLDKIDLVDVWREHFPDKNGFTWRKLRPKPVFSRLDYLLISSNLLQFSADVEILPGFRTDHSMVQLKLNFCPEKRGPGYWKLNCSLLKDSNYVNSINKLIEIELSQNSHMKYKDRWELLKLAVRGSSIQYASRKSKSNKLKISLLEKRLKKLYKELDEGETLFSDTDEQIRLVKHELSELIRQKARGAMIRSKANWAYKIFFRFRKD